MIRSGVVLCLVLAALSTRSPAAEPTRAEARTASGGIFIREAIVRAVGEPEAPYQYLGWKQGARRAPDPEQPDSERSGDRP